MRFNVEIKTLDVLEWHQEFSPEQQEYIDELKETFKFKLERHLQNSVPGFWKIEAFFDFNPVTQKFTLTNCESPMKHHVINALNTELKTYIK